MKFVHFAFIFVALFGTSCALYDSATFMPFTNDSVLKGEGGSYETVDGIQFWEIGSPEKPFRIVGIIRQNRNTDNSVMSVLAGLGSKSRIAELAKEHRGQGVIVISRDSRITGYSSNSFSFGQASGQAFDGYAMLSGSMQQFGSTTVNTSSTVYIAVIRYVRRPVRQLQ